MKILAHSDANGSCFFRIEHDLLFLKVRGVHTFSEFDNFPRFWIPNPSAIHFVVSCNRPINITNTTAYHGWSTVFVEFVLQSMIHVCYHLTPPQIYFLQIMCYQNYYPTMQSFVTFYTCRYAKYLHVLFTKEPDHPNTILDVIRTIRLHFPKWEELLQLPNT